MYVISTHVKACVMHVCIRCSTHTWKVCLI